MLFELFEVSVRLAFGAIKCVCGCLFNLDRERTLRWIAAVVNNVEMIIHLCNNVVGVTFALVASKRDLRRKKWIFGGNYEFRKRRPPGALVIISVNASTCQCIFHVSISILSVKREVHDWESLNVRLINVWDHFVSNKVRFGTPYNKLISSV